MSDKREFKESPLYMGENETVAFDLTVPSSWGSSIETDSAECFLYDGDSDVSTSKLTGSASVSSQVITTQLVSGLAAGKKYKLVVRWEDSGNTLEAWGWIICE